jgi:hypothetical protein
MLGKANTTRNTGAIMDANITMLAASVFAMPELFTSHAPSIMNANDKKAHTHHQEFRGEPDEPLEVT